MAGVRLVESCHDWTIRTRGALEAVVLCRIDRRVLLATIVAPKLFRFWRVDTCLDHGGRYNYAEGRCEVREDASRPE